MELAEKSRPESWNGSHVAYRARAGIQTNYLKHKIDEAAQSPLCRISDKKSEAISHIVSKCEKLAQKEYKRRYDSAARIVHWKLCGK